MVRLNDISPAAALRLHSLREMLLLINERNLRSLEISEHIERPLSINGQ